VGCVQGRHSSGDPLGKAANWRERAERCKLGDALSVFRTDVVRGFFRVLRSAAPALAPARLTGSLRPGTVGVTVGVGIGAGALLVLVLHPSVGQGESEPVVRGMSARSLASWDTREGPILGRAVKLPGLGRKPIVPTPAPPPAPKPAPKPDRDFSAAERTQPEAAVVTTPPAPPPPPPPPSSPPAEDYAPAPPAAPAPDPPPVFFDDSG
jgi:hypothetical protein